MKRLGLGLLVVLTVTALTPAGDRTSLYTSPQTPSREVLDRLNLKQAWIAHIPMESRKDGIYSVQFPEIDLVRFTKAGPVETSQMIVQTRSGLIVALNRLTGEIMWQSRVGKPYQATLPLAFNSRTVIETAGLDATGLDRFTGEILWTTQLPGGPIAAPVADEGQLYIALADRKLRVYEIPDMDLYHLKEFLAKRKEQMAEKMGEKGSGQKGSGSGNPLYSGTADPAHNLGIGTESARSLYQTEQKGPHLIEVRATTDDYHVNADPILTDTKWVVLGSTGTAVGMTRWEGKETMKFSPGAAMLLSPGVYGIMAYIAADNQKLYALDTFKGEPAWVYGAGSTIDYQPFVSDDDVFLSVARKGLMRLDRLTGEPRWKSAAASADRVIASNPKFVYALDRESRLVVLDRTRGTEVSRLDSRDFPYPVVNEHSDRIFLAAHDGTILCLYDKDYPTQRIMKNSAIDDGGKANPIYQRLQQTITIKEALADKPLRAVLEFCDKELRLPIIVRKEAFPNKAAMDAYLEQPVTLEQAVNVPLGQVLSMLLKKDNVKAKYSVRPGYILVEPLPEKK